MLRVAWAVIGVVAFLALAGAVYQVVANGVDARRFPEPGRLVDIGGFKLQLNCTGKGTPTVILESGLGDVLPEWTRVQSGIAKFTRVCSYDRAGYGTSDAGPMPRTSAEEARELHRLLKTAGERPPFVVVGHSFGGYTVRVFNGNYPDEVAGMVLVDATQEDQYNLLPTHWNAVGAELLQRYHSQARWASVFIDMGVARAMLAWKGVHSPSLYLILQSKYVQARASELEQIRVSAEQARAANHIRDKPLIVLTAGKVSDASLVNGLSATDLAAYQEIWANDLQKRLARLSVRGRHIIVPDSSHDIPTDRPDAIVSAVKEIAIQ
ncbi:MAG: alpha/beta hydrolase [Acidobacteriaceae bacterium]|nr:alpha/beta hydrolase [Acidobacteriaceae bacterium]